MLASVTDGVDIYINGSVDNAGYLGGAYDPAQNISKVPLTHENAILLRRWGVDAPVPIREEYGVYKYPFMDGEYPPRAHQYKASEFLVSNERGYDLSDMGVGKTASALWAMDYLFNMQVIKKVLVIAPLSTLQDVWGNEVFKIAPRLRYAILHGSKSQRSEMLNSDALIHIINHDGIKVIKDALLKVKYDLVIIDEVTAFGDSSSDRWRAMSQICKDVPLVWGLTGTPLSNGPLKAYHMARLVNPSKLNITFSAYRDRVMFRPNTGPGGPNIWLPKRNKEVLKREVYDILQPAFRVKLDDCLDIPHTEYDNAPVHLTMEQLNALKALKTSNVWKGVTVKHATVLIHKWLQVLSGVLIDSEHYDDDGDSKIHEIDSTPRYDKVYELVKSAEKKCLVFGTYVAANKRLAAFLTAKGLNVGLVYGAVSRTKRDEIFKQFRHKHGLDVIVAHPATMSHGLTLVEANRIVWTAPPDTETYIQANRRIRRGGQDMATDVVHVTSTALETDIYNRLAYQQDLEQSVLALYEEHFLLEEDTV